MRCLSLIEPYCWLVANGHKTIETRTMRFKIETPETIAICRSKSKPLATGEAYMLGRSDGAEILNAADRDGAFAKKQCGEVVALATVVKVGWLQASELRAAWVDSLNAPNAKRRIGYHLAHVYKLEAAIPIAGALGLFKRDLAFDELFIKFDALLAAKRRQA